MKKINIKNRLSELKNMSGIPEFTEDGYDYIFLPAKIFQELFIKSATLIEEILGLPQNPEIVEDEYSGIWLKTNIVPDNYIYNGISGSIWFKVIIDVVRENKTLDIDKLKHKVKSKIKKYYGKKSKTN